MSAPPPSPARRVLERAQRANAGAGHENRGALSATRGFLPARPPLQRFSEAHLAWDDAARDLPALYWGTGVRAALDRLPVLSARPEDLADAELQRAATVLGTLAHAYVHQTAEPVAALPDGLAVPWAEVRRRLGRRPDPVMSYRDLIVDNWRPTADGPLRVAGLDVLVPTTGTQEERVFYLTQVEILARCGPVVGAVCRAQDAVLGRDPDRLGAALADVRAALHGAREALRLIDPRPGSPTHVDPVVWAKAVAPLAVPFTPGVLGPSGTASPVFSLLDAFFGRTRYDSRLGREIAAHRRDAPPHWRHFLDAVEQVPVGDAVRRHGSAALIDAYDAALAAYAGDDGFLGRHRRKVFGYLGVAFAVGRDLTIGGFSGRPHESREVDVDTALTASRTERGAPAAANPAERGPARTTTDRPVTLAELARHNDPAHGWWVALDGRVYDLTCFLDRHPGGPAALQAHAGVDATGAFARAHRRPPDLGRVRGVRAVGRLVTPEVDRDHRAAHAGWLRVLRATVLLENALRLDRSFAERDLLPGGGPAPLQADRAADTLRRYAHGHLRELERAIDRQAAADPGCCRRSAVPALVTVHRDGDGDPVPGLRRLQQRLATVKDVVLAALAAVEEHGNGAQETRAALRSLPAARA